MDQATTSPVLETAAKDNGKPLRPFGYDLSQTKAFQDQRSLVTSMLYDRKSLGGVAGQAVANSKAMGEEAQDYRDRVATIKALSFMTGVSPQEVQSNFAPIQRQVEAQHKWDYSPTVSSFADKLQGLFQQQDAQKEAMTSLQSKAVQDAVTSADKGMARNPLQAFGEWEKETAGTFPDMPEAQKLQMFNSVYLPIQQQMNTPQGALAKEIVDTFHTGNELTRTTGGNATDLIDKLSPYTPEQRQQVYQLANAYAQTKDPTASINNPLWNMAQGLLRSTGNMSSSMSDAAQRILSGAQIKDAEQGGLQGQIDTINGKDGATPDTAGVAAGKSKLNAVNIGAELRNASQSMNPLPLGYGLPGFLNTSISQALNATPYLAGFAANPMVGTGLMYASTVADQQQRLLANNPNMDIGKATLMAEGYAAPMTALMSISLPGVTGMFPAVERTLAQFAKEGTFANYAAHTGVGVVGMDLSSASQIAGDALAKAIDKDFNPGKPISEQLADLARAQPELLGSMMILSAVGAGKVIGDPDKQAQLAKLVGDTGTLKKLGFSADQVEKIQSSSLQEVQGVIAAEAPKRTPENIAQGIASARQDGKTTKDAAESHETPTLTTADDGTHVIMAPDGKGGMQEVYRTKDQEAAMQALAMAYKAHDEGQIKTLNETLDYFKQADKAQGVEGRTYETSLTPDKEKVTFQDMLEQGTPIDQLKERMRIAGIHEDTSLSNVVVDGMTKGDQYEDVVRVLNASPRTAIHERLDATTARALDSGKVSDEQMTKWVRQTEEATGQKYLQTPEGQAPSRQEIVEAITAIGEEYAAGHLANRDAAPSALKGYFKSMVRYFNNILSRAKVLHNGIKEGKIDPNFENHLAEGIGLPIHERLAPAEAKAKVEMMGEKVADSKPLEQGTLFSIHQRDADYDFSISTRSDQERVQAELEKRIASSPTQRAKIFENALKRFESINARQDKIKEAFASGKSDSSEVARKDMESSLVELNAIVSALPPEIRSSLTRNWHNPKTGEPFNIYTKYASLGSNKAKADFLIKQIDRASELIDHALSSEYLERGYKLLESSQPFNERGKGLQGKITPEGHRVIDKITDLWHMDEGQVADYIQSRQKQLADPEIEPEKQAELEQEIHLAQIHGNFSPVDAKGTYKDLGAEMSADDRAQAVESLKNIVRDGRFDWQTVKDENKVRWENNRAEAKTAMLGSDREATSAEIAKSREGAATALAGVAKRFDSHLSRLDRFSHILGDASKPWIRRILDATNQKADMDQQIDHSSHEALIKSIFGEKESDNLFNRTRLKMVIADLSMGKDTGAFSLENQSFKKTKVSKTLAESFVKDPATWMGTDTELNYLSRSLSALGKKSRVKGFDVYYPQGDGDKVELHLSEMEAIQRLLSWRQPDARLKMERNGMSQETADALEKFVTKTKEGRAFYDYLKDAYDNYDKINAVYSRMFGVDMPRVNNYAPTSYDTAKGTEDPVGLDEYGGGAGSMAGFTKTRQSHAAKVKDSNAWITYQAHTDAVNYWLSHAELVRDFRATFGNTDVLRAAEAKSSADREYLTNFIKYLSRDNATTAALTGFNSKFARIASNILSNSALAFNIGVTLKHIIPSMSSAMKMDAADFITSAIRVASNQAIRPAIFGENSLYSSPEVMRFANASHSGSDSDAAQVAKESKGLGRKTKLAAEAAGKWGHSWITSFVHGSNAVSSAIAYDSAYREAIKAGADPEGAHSLASQRVDEILHETCPPVFGVDRPIGEEGNPFQATIARFAGPVRQRLGVVIDTAKETPGKLAAAETAGGKAAVLGDASWKMAAAWVIPGLMEHAIKQAYLAMLGTNQQQEDAKSVNEYLGAALSGPIYGLYWGGPIAASAIKAWATGETTHMTTGNPLFDEVKSLTGAVKRKMGKSADKNPVADDITIAKAGLNAAAMILGLVGLTHTATAAASISGALNPARVISKKLEDDGTVKEKK